MANLLAIRVGLRGGKQTIRTLNRLSASTRRRVHRGALDEAARKGVSESKRFLKVRRTGLLKKAMAYKAKQNGQDRGYRVIGADRGFKTVVPGSRWQTTFPMGVTVTLSGKGKRNKKPRTAKISARGFNLTAGLSLNPAKYAHLVEGGRVSTYPKRSKAMFFRVNKGSGMKSSLVWAQKVKAVKGQEFMAPTGEKLKLMFPGIVAKHLQKAA
jgi:hypothetical protein